jgi:hypothetical protein
VRTLLPLPLLAACVVTVSSDKESDPDPAHTGEIVTEPTPPDADGDGFGRDVDCDDLDPRVFPGAPPRCDVDDADCDGMAEPRTLVPTDAALGDALAGGGLVCLEAGDHAGAAMSGGAATLGARVPGSARLVGDGAPALALDGGATLVVEDLELAGNAGALVVTDATLTLDRVTVRGVDCACEGALLVAEDATVVVRDSALDGVGQSVGGEGPVRIDGGSLALERTVVSGTRSHATQGGLLAVRDATVTVTDVTVADTVVTTDTQLQGGVVWAVDSAITWRRVAVTDLALSGGAVHGGVLYGFGATFDLGEVAVAGVTADAPGEVVRGLVAEVSLDGGLAAVDSTFLSGAVTADSCVGLAFTSIGPDVSLTNVGVQDFRCGAATVSLVDLAPSATNAVRYSAFADSDGGFDGIGSPIGVDGVTDAAGTFVSAAPPWDLAPAAGSAWIDAGDPALTDPDGTRSDLGAAGSTW